MNDKINVKIYAQADPMRVHRAIANALHELAVEEEQSTGVPRYEAAYRKAWERHRG